MLCVFLEHISSFLCAYLCTFIYFIVNLYVIREIPYEGKVFKLTKFAGDEDIKKNSQLNVSKCGQEKCMTFLVTTVQHEINHNAQTYCTAV